MLIQVEASYKECLHSIDDMIKLRIFLYATNKYRMRSAGTHQTLISARKSDERMKFCRTERSLNNNAGKPGEFTKVWTGTHESLEMKAQKSGERAKA